MAILQEIPKVFFNPENPEHVKAMVGLLFEGKQHEYLRFVQDFPMASVPSELSLKFIAHHLPNDLRKVAEDHFAQNQKNMTGF